MKKNLIYIIAFTGVLAFGTGAYFVHLERQTTASPNSKPGVYQNDEYNFCFNYPSNFSLTTLPRETNLPATLSLRISAPQSKTEGNDPATEMALETIGSLLVTLITPASSNVEGYVTAVIGEQFIVSKKETSINELSAILVDAKSAFDGSPYTATYILLPALDSNENSLLTASYEQTSDHSKVFNDIVASIRKKDPGADCK